MSDIGLTAVGSPPEELDQFIPSRIGQCAKVIKASGATADCAW